jgi:aromatic ring hydroxylase
MKEINNNIQECPYCGSEEYYTKERYKGECETNHRFDGRITENGAMYDCAEHSYKSKYAWCRNCDRRLFKIE